MASWTPQTKSSSNFSSQSKSSTPAWSAQTKSVPKAQSGQYYGFGAFTYSGGQPLSGNLSWTPQTKSS